LVGWFHLLSGLARCEVGASTVSGVDLTQDAIVALADRFIEGHLNHLLDSETIMRALGVSRTRLYAAFASRGGVHAAIRNARLDRARLMLATSTIAGRSLADVAQSCGFADYASFARAAFRGRFGCAPRDIRPPTSEAAPRS
jgi:AraC family transcriptional activator of tynA and feaB